MVKRAFNEKALDVLDHPLATIGIWAGTILFVGYSMWSVQQSGWKREQGWRIEGKNEWIANKPKHIEELKSAALGDCLLAAAAKNPDAASLDMHPVRVCQENSATENYAENLKQANAAIADQNTHWYGPTYKIRAYQVQ